MSLYAWVSHRESLLTLQVTCNIPLYTHAAVFFVSRLIIRVTGGGDEGKGIAEELVKEVTISGIENSSAFLAQADQGCIEKLR